MMKRYLAKIGLLMATMILASSAMVAQSSTSGNSNADVTLPSLDPSSASVSLKTVRALFPDVPVAVANELFGGLHSVNTVAILNGGDQTELNDAELQVGMLVYVEATNMYYRYKGADADGSNDATQSASGVADLYDSDGVATNYWESLADIIYASVKEITTVDATGDVITATELGTDGKLDQSELVAAGTGVPTDNANGDLFVIQDATTGNPLQTFVYNDGTWTLIATGNTVTTSTASGDPDSYTGGDIIVGPQTGDVVINAEGDTYVYDGDSWEKISDSDVAESFDNDDNDATEEYYVDANGDFFDNSTGTPSNITSNYGEGDIIQITNEDGTTVTYVMDNNGDFVLISDSDDGDLVQIVDLTTDDNVRDNDPNTITDPSYQDPSNYTEGDLIKVTNDADDYITYTLDNGTWIEISSSANYSQGSGVPTSPNTNAREGDVYTDTDNGDTYIYDGDSWEIITDGDIVEVVNVADADVRDNTPTTESLDPAAYKEGDIIKLIDTDGDFSTWTIDGGAWVKISENISAQIVEESAGDANVANNTPTAAPADYNEGDIVIITDTDGDKKSFVHDGTGWKELTTATADYAQEETVADIENTGLISNSDPNEGDLTKLINATGEYVTYMFNGTAWIEIARGDEIADLYHVYEVAGDAAFSATTEIGAGFASQSAFLTTDPATTVANDAGVTNGVTIWFPADWDLNFNVV